MCLADCQCAGDPNYGVVLQRQKERPNTGRGRRVTSNCFMGEGQLRWLAVVTLFARIAMPSSVHVPFVIRTFVIYKATAVVRNVNVVQIVKVAGTQLRLHPYGWVVKKLFDDSQRFF